ncbi:unnamed protein product [Allacma fusca]|uniref:Uncharacterized protein n=1 Tax=Allacma fusca TaxID=39272 RepID=A0A8J2LS01_9HEXA|nr:unnamed protein product [Allacma fusca]
MPKFQYKGTAKIDLSQVLERHRRIPKLMDFFFSNSSKKNRRTDFPVINWQSCKETNFPSDHDLTENVTQSSLLKALIRGMTENPMVRLFSGENLTGDSEDYHSGQNRRSERKGCHRVRNLANVKTAVTSQFKFLLTFSYSHENEIPARDDTYTGMSSQGAEIQLDIPQTIL